MNVLFLNHKIQQCGVYQYGKRLYDILKKSGMTYVEIDGVNDYIYAIEKYSPHSIIYNYHQSTMPWLNYSTIQKKVKNIGIPHESPEGLFDIICDIDPTINDTERRISIPRPIFENVDNLLKDYIPPQTIKDFIEYSEEGVPIFGSFGFGCLHKGFYKIVQIINEQYESAIIKLIIPGAYFDINRENTIYNMKKMCEGVSIKSTIKIMITHEFVSNEDLLLFLKSNTMNLFLYDKLEGRGISSVIDYALSVKVPLGISDSYMFRHIYSDDICVYKKSIRDCIKNSENHCSPFLEKYSNKELILKFENIFTHKKKGIFYNSKKSLCSIWESGKMCYDVLKKSNKYILDYSEETVMDHSYDFAIFNQHIYVNNWINHDIIKQFNKPTYCIVTEVTFGDSPISNSPSYFDHYIILDPTINETSNIHAFGRPLEEFDISSINTNVQNVQNIKIFSFGFATNGKEWHKIIEAVQNEYDTAEIHFNIAHGTYIPEEMQKSNMAEIVKKCYDILHKPGIKLKITSDNLSKSEIIQLCSEQTLNCFFYNREHLFNSGLAAVTDQAISSGCPLLVTSDRTFRHIHKYLDYYPTIGIKEAIEKNREGVLKMKNDWSNENFIMKFEKILI